MSMNYIITDEPKRLEYLISRKLGFEIIKLENAVLDIEELKNRIENSTILLRIYSPYKLIPISIICEKYAKKVINSSKLIITSLIRELLYRELEKNNIQTPRRLYIFDLCNVSDIANKIGKTNMLLTFTKTDIEGVVETAQALVSLIEHRYYMSAEDVKVNLVIPNIEDIKNILVVGKEPSIDIDMVRKVVDILGEGIYTITVGKQDGREVVLYIDPVPSIENDEDIEKVLEYLKNILKLN